jgi:hypothetical protein
VLAVLPLLAASHTEGQSKETAKRRLFVDGTQIPSSRVLVKDGVEYVEVAAIAEAMGAKVEDSDAGVQVTSAGDCEKLAVEGRRFSTEFRTDVLALPDEIESLRAVVFKKDVDPTLGPRFDEVDKRLGYSQTHIMTDADQAVYYALAYANNSLAISYYKKLRGAAVEETQKAQLDSMMCAMESKFALMKGVLVQGGSCSVFKRIEAQAATTKTNRAPKQE